MDSKKNKNMKTNELYLKTAFCCMACDGDIAKEEVALIEDMTTKDNLFSVLDVQGKINEYVAAINREGKLFLNKYIEEVKATQLDDESALQLIKVAIKTIEADNQIEYSEISFFKKIRKNLQISDEAILKELPDKEDYLLPDIEDDYDFDWNVSFGEIQITPID